MKMMETKLQKSLKWEIDNFSERKSSIRSPLFSSSGCEWYVLLHPKGDEVDNHLSLYLCVANPKSLQPEWKKRAGLRFVLLNQSGKVVHSTSEGSELFRAEIPGWGFRKAMPLRKLQDTELLEENKLIIEVYTTFSEVSRGYEYGQFIFHGQELVNFRGFHVLPCQVIPLSRIFAKHPNFAVHVNSKRKEVKTSFMNVLLDLIKTLDKPLERFTKTELYVAYNKLTHLSSAGFKLDWLKSKLDDISLEWKKENALARIQELEEKVKKLEIMSDDTMDDLNMERVKVLSLEKTVSDLRVELDKEKAKSDTKPTCMSLDKTVLDDLKVEMDKEEVKPDTDQPTCMSLDKTVLDDLRVEMDKEEVKPDTDQPTFLSLDKTMLDNLKVEMDKEEVKPDTDQPKVSSLKEDNVSSTKPKRLGVPRRRYRRED